MIVEQIVKEVERLATGSWLKTALVGSEFRMFWSQPRTLVVFFRPVPSSTSEAYFLKVRVPTPHNILHFLQKRENKVGTVCKTHFPLITSSVIS